MKTLLIDNYDSFTFNVAQYVAEVNGEEPVVVRNDELSFEEVLGLDADNIVISPGPGTPEAERDFGVCRDVILSAPCPILGICMGFQGIALLHGSKDVKAPEPRHGRGSRVVHEGSDLFRGIPSPFYVIRYHSLYVPALSGSELEATARTEDGLIMALRHLRKPIWGVQFHPESIATEHGFQIFRNFRDLTVDASAGVRSLHFGPARDSRRQTRVSSAGHVRFRRLDGAPPPEAVFQALYAGRAPAVWLDSSTAAGEVSRFSFIADGSHDSDYVVRYRSRQRELEIVRSRGRQTLRRSLFDFLKNALTEGALAPSEPPFPFCGGFIGYFGYEMKGECGGGYRHESALPDAWFLKASRFLVFDHRTGDCHIVAIGGSEEQETWIAKTAAAIERIGPAAPPALRPEVAEPAFTLEQDRESYMSAIEKALDKIRRGESYQVCLTNRLRCDFDGDPFELYRIIRRRNPAPFSLFLDAGDFQVLGSSPERFLRIDASGIIESRPIKGTIARSSDPSEDRRLREALAGSEKNRSENLMIVDLVRNDLGRVARTGSVHVPSLMAIEPYATVHHIVSTIRGRLGDAYDAVDCIRAAFPGGSMTGAPKIRTMEILDGLESSARGVYSGAAGYLSLTGDVDLSIVIRTMVASGGALSLGVGGGVVAMSDPDDEFEEAVLKGRALMLAVSEYLTGRADCPGYAVSGAGEKRG